MMSPALPCTLTQHRADEKGKVDAILDRCIRSKRMPTFAGEFTAVSGWSTFSLLN
jgi:hypothetical protein